jgi:hypothetical protein
MSTEMRDDPNICNHAASARVRDEIKGTASEHHNGKKVTHGSVMPSVKIKQQFKMMNGTSALPNSTMRR